VPVHEPSALFVTSSENVTTMREPSGTSRWPSIGNVNTTPGSAVASGATDESHALRNAATTTTRLTSQAQTYTLSRRVEHSSTIR